MPSTVAPSISMKPTQGNVTTETGVHHIIVIIEENHSFDFYFGLYCTAAPDSNPTCNIGPDCCEKAPANFTTSSKAVSSQTILTTQSFGSGCGHAERYTIIQSKHIYM